MSERRHRHLVEIRLTLLTKAHMSLRYWPYAFQAATNLINRMPASTLQNKPQFEMLFGQTPNYLKLKQFRCLCFPLTQSYNRHKRQPKSRPCVFMGYSKIQSVYPCLDLATNRL